jgi:glycosyltransferase involved in cell wall biosynthesis
MDSVSSQTYPDVIHVIVDGLSLDNTKCLVRARLSHRIVFISEPDTGIYSAWNKGIRLVVADWYLFLGADDLLLPHAIQALADEVTRSGGVNMATGCCRLVRPSGELLSVMGSAYKPSILWHHMPNANCSTLYHCSLFDSTPWFDESYRSAADYLFLLKNRGRITSVHTCSILSVMRTGGISTSKPRLSLMESLRAKLSSYPRSIHLLIYAAHLLSLAKTSILMLQPFGHDRH